MCLLGIISRDNIAGVVREKQFAGHLIDSDTELVFMDEWTEDSLCCEDTKKLLQGKYITCGVCLSVFNGCYDMAFSDYYIIPNHDSFIILLMNALYFLGGLVYLSRKNKDAIKVNYKS